MSSRVFPPDDDRPASPLVWRQVGAAAAAGEAAPDPSARLAQLETLYRQKALEATAELQPVLERLGRAIEEIANLRARLRWEAEADVVQLALAIARRVIRRELASDPDALRGLAMAALEKLQGQEIARVKVHPSHVAMVKSRAVGSVIFETTRGNLDASVDSQLQEIERGLADRLRKQS